MAATSQTTHVVYPSNDGHYRFGGNEPDNPKLIALEQANDNIVSHGPPKEAGDYDHLFSANGLAKCDEAAEVVRQANIEKEKLVITDSVQAEELKPVAHSAMSQPSKGDSKGLGEDDHDTELSEEARTLAPKRSPYVGAREQGRKLQWCLEEHLKAVYAEELEAGTLTLTLIHRDGDTKLYEDLKNFRKKCGYLPFDMPTQRTNAAHRRANMPRPLRCSSPKP